MRILLSTIGSRGDVQPLAALAKELRALGPEVRLCVPPDFRDWIQGLGLSVTPIGPELRKMTAAASAAPSAPPSPEQLRRMAEATVHTQFETITAAAKGCDAIVAATGLQIAARSVAQSMGIPYIFAVFCPAVLPSPHHAPPVYGLRGQTPASSTADNGKLWDRDAASFNNSFGNALNAHRASLGLSPVSDVRGHIFGDRPWLAADPILAPWPAPEDQSVFQTGAWVLPDERPLPPELEAFLETGEPPVYFGFGSVRAPHDLGRVMIQTARALGRRAIVSRGWAGLSLADDGPDCLAIDEVNQQALFKKVAAVVHHGGAGTTTAAAFAGAPQVIIPQMFDQHYWARQIRRLGIGTAHAPGAPAADSLTDALKSALRPDIAARAESVAVAMPGDGAAVAARRVTTIISRH